jgi:hypothetical protein
MPGTEPGHERQTKNIQNSGRFSLMTEDKFPRFSTLGYTKTKLCPASSPHAADKAVACCCRRRFLLTILGRFVRDQRRDEYGRAACPGVEG